MTVVRVRRAFKVEDAGLGLSDDSPALNVMVMNERDASPFTPEPGV
jgi:hypothetical protein